jgi:glycine/D-amino acid oxidase-like deaminating enzyme
MHMADVVVVGAGIVGASVAYHAARSGAEVTLVDKSLPASGVTGDSFAWIGGPGGGDVVDGSTPLRQTALQDYRRLEVELPAVQVRWTGSLAWSQDEPVKRSDPGHDEYLVGAARAGQLEPNLRLPPAQALYQASDGAVDPVAITEALVRGAQDHGADLVLGVAVIALRPRDGQVVGVETSTGFVPSRTVVLTAGVDAPALCAPLGFDLPVAPSPALLLRFTAPPGLVRTLVSNTQVEVREAADGRLLVAADYNGEASQDALNRTARKMLSRLTATFTGTEDVQLLEVRLGIRPMPADGLPIIGPLPGIGGTYVAVMHSGVTLAPAVGRLVATELADGVEAHELHALRPDRFSSNAAG